MFVFLQKPDKQKSADAFVAIGEGMVFDDEIQQVCCLFLNAWIKVNAAKGLHYTLQGSCKAVIFFITEKRCCFFPVCQLLFQLGNSNFCFGIGDFISDVFIQLFGGNAVAVVLIEQYKTLGILCNDFY